METIDRYHKWVAWSEEDGVYIGKCPDLITGVHGELKRPNFFSEQEVKIHG